MLKCLSFTALILMCTTPALSQASSSSKLEYTYIYTDIHTEHFDPKPEHVDDQNMIGVEMKLDFDWAFGVSFFDNSFGQNSEYVYLAYKWNLYNTSIRTTHELFINLRAGLLHGYRDKYENKVPLNETGIAPAPLPALGYRYRNFVGELSLGGTSIIIMTAGILF